MRIVQVAIGHGIVRAIVHAVGGLPLFGAFAAECAVLGVDWQPAYVQVRPDTRRAVDALAAAQGAYVLPPLVVGELIPDLAVQGAGPAAGAAEMVGCMAGFQSPLKRAMKTRITVKATR